MVKATGLTYISIYFTKFSNHHWVYRMKKFVLYDFYLNLKNDNQCLLYNGNFSDNITFKIIEIIEANIKHQNESLKTQKRVSYLMAECFQNIIRHGDNSEKETLKKSSSNFFMTRNYAGKYYILSGNRIKNTNIAVVKSQIDQINSLNADELKKMHHQVLRFGKVSKKGGAGLGLIDMARKSGYKIGYKFVTLDPETSLFYNQIVLNSDHANAKENEAMVGIDTAINLQQKMVDAHILMLQKGDFSQESILPVLNIIERSIIESSNKSIAMKKLYKATVEVLQNISKHAYTVNDMREGIFLLSLINGHYDICTGNFIHNRAIEKLSHHLNKINQLTTDELEEWYSEKLMNELDEENNENYGLGLIDLAMVLSDKIQHRFIKIDDEKSFFTIEVRL